MFSSVRAKLLTALTLHNAPPVIYPLGRSCFLGGLLLALWLAGFLVLLLWYYVTRQLDWRMALTLVAVLSAGVMARNGWRNVPIGRLSWDGKVWRWESSGYQTGMAEHELSVIADFQSMLLLRLENQARARLWLWVEQKALPERWLDLRRAVYSTRKPGGVSMPHDALQAQAPATVAVLDAMPPVDVPPIKP